MSRAEERAKDRAYRAKMRRYRPTALDIARHESGHAIAMLATGTPFGSIVLDPPLRPGDKVRCYGIVTRINARDPWREAVISFAGPMAEGHYLTGRVDVDRVVALNPAWVRDRSVGSPGRAARDLVLAHAAVIDALAELVVAEREVPMMRAAEALPHLGLLVDVLRPPRADRTVSANS